MTTKSLDLIKAGGAETISVLEKLFSSSGEGIMLFDEKGVIQMANPRSLEMFGYQGKELLGQKVEKLVPSPARSGHEQYRKAYTKEPHPRRMGVGRDLSGLRKDGSTFPLEISLSYMDHNDKKFVVAFITDISIRKKNEEKLEEQRKKLREYTNELEQKVKARTSELQHMNLGLHSQIQERKIAETALKKSLKDLKAAEQEILLSLEKEKELGELKSRFVSMASHEFRTPLTTILSSANLISKYTESEQQSSREKHVERIRSSVQNLTNILNDFLSLDKLESGSQSAEFQEVNVGELIREITEELSGGLKKGQEIFSPEEDLTCTTDARILRNILINLISNASKYSDVDQPIRISAEKTHEINIHVSDEGIGIPLDEQGKLFERFYRAGNAVNIQGTGLGLHIVRKYAHLLQGEISFQSKPDKGSVFTLKIPIHPQA